MCGLIKELPLTKDAKACWCKQNMHGFLGSLSLLLPSFSTHNLGSMESGDFEMPGSAIESWEPRYRLRPSLHAHMELTQVWIQLQSTTHLAASLH